MQQVRAKLRKYQDVRAAVRNYPVRSTSAAATSTSTSSFAGPDLQRAREVRRGAARAWPRTGRFPASSTPTRR